LGLGEWFVSCDDISTHHYRSKVKSHLPSQVSTHPGLKAKGQIQPEESVRKCLQVIGCLDAETSGLLLSHNGDKERWKKQSVKMLQTLRRPFYYYSLGGLAIALFLYYIPYARKALAI
jgi:hypothetical protein